MSSLIKHCPTHVGVGNAREWPMDPTCRFHPWNRANPFPLLGQLTRKMGGLSRILSIQTYQWLPQSGGKNYESASNSFFFATETIVGWCAASNTEKRQASQPDRPRDPRNPFWDQRIVFSPTSGWSLIKLYCQIFTKTSQFLCKWCKKRKGTPDVSGQG